MNLRLDLVELGNFKVELRQLQVVCRNLVSVLGYTVTRLGDAVCVVVGPAVPHAVLLEELDVVITPSSGKCRTPCMRYESTLMMEAASYPEAPTHDSHPRSQQSRHLQISHSVSRFFGVVGLTN